MLQIFTLDVERGVEVGQGDGGDGRGDDGAMDPAPCFTCLHCKSIAVFPRAKGPSLVVYGVLLVWKQLHDLCG